ncbi:Imm42 family immunity protein [Acetivibrio straminisolvens]|uniref:Imm42 family immunity protein n=1 Tax=Acetivibrio straminisolvens TaxID=253314 RepID=UPI00389917B2
MIIVLKVNEWNNDGTFDNGILIFCIDGNFFPKEIVTSTLSYEVPLLKKNLKKVTVNKELYSMQKNKAFAEIYNMTFPKDIDVDNDYRFDITPQSFADNDCY